MTHGDLIRKYRKEKGMTMKQLGEMVGVSEQAISQYELGKRRVNPQLLLKFVDVLNIDINELEDFDQLHVNIIKSGNERECYQKLVDVLLSNTRKSRKDSLEYALINSLLDALKINIKLYLSSRRYNTNDENLNFIISEISDIITDFLDQVELDNMESRTVEIDGQEYILR